VELLRLLSNTAGAPGFEEPIRKVMVDQMRPYATSITFDGMGSIIATQGTTGPRIMVDAHMDELGGMVPADERTRVYPRDSLFLDVGASSEAEVRAMGISVGDPIVPDAPFEVLNGTANYLGKGWDDRVGCAVVVEAMRRLATTPHPNQIIYALTTQEEIGLRGAHTALDVIKPDLGIAIEGGITGDMFPGRPAVPS